FVSSAVYYGHNFNSKNLAGNRYLNVFLSGIVEIPALLLLVLINNKLGRRWTSALYMLISGLASFSILIIDLTVGMEEMSALTLTCALIGKSFIAGGWAAVQIFSAETFPTVIR
ncbi:solute carrier family 22 member 15-like, partial [Elysia marginata]